MDQVHRERIKAVRRRLEAERADGLLVTHRPGAHRLYVGHPDKVELAEIFKNPAQRLGSIGSPDHKGVNADRNDSGLTHRSIVAVRCGELVRRTCRHSNARELCLPISEILALTRPLRFR